MIKLIKEKFTHNKESFQLYLGNSLISIFNFLSIALLSHVLIPNEYGYFRYILMITSIAISLGSFGFAQSIYYYLTKSSTAQQAYNYINALRIGLLLSTLFIVLGLYAYQIIWGNASEMLDWNKYSFWVILLIIPGIFQSVDLNIFLSMKRVGVYFLNTLTILTIKFALLFIAYTIKASLIHYLLILGVLGALPSLFNNIYIQRVFWEEKFQFHLDLLKQIWAYGLPIGIGLFFGIIMSHADKLMLSLIFKDPISLARISNGNFEIPLITVFYTSFSAIAFPYMMKEYNNNNIKGFLEIRKRYQKEVVLILFPIVLALISWAPSLINLAFGSFYESSAVFFVIYSATFFYRFSSYHDVFLITGKTRYISIIQGLELVFHVVLTYFLVKQYGLIGASIAHLITNTIYVYICTFISKSILGVRMIDVLPFWYLYKIFFIAAVLMFPFYFASEYFENNIVKLVFAGVYVVSCILILYKLEQKKVTIA